jgi:D-glycero-D-manno-heptose 1,7-bisphosphate phosphatase
VSPFTNIRHVILDRDGVLNEEAPDGGYILTVGDLHWLPGSLEGLALLQSHGIRVSVATNQSAVGRGLMEIEALEAILSAMDREVSAAGGALAAIFYCPHAPDAHCNCRKPRPALLNAAVVAAEIAAAQTVFVGDDGRDLEAARAAGIAAALVRSGKGRRTETLLQPQGLAIPVFDDLLQFARELVGEPVAAGVT